MVGLDECLNVNVSVKATYCFCFKRGSNHSRVVQFIDWDFGNTNNHINFKWLFSKMASEGS